MDKWGRKPLLILGAIIMAVSMIALGFMFNAGSVALGALIVVCIYIAGFSLSWGPVVWVMLAEIFPNSIRDKAMAIAVAAQWFMNWVVTVTFNIMDGNYGADRLVQPRLRLLAVRRLQRAGGAVRLEVRPGEQGHVAREHAEALEESPAEPRTTARGTLTVIEHLPSDWRQAVLVGRMLTREGPTPVVVVEGRVRDVSQARRHGVAAAQWLERHDSRRHRSRAAGIVRLHAASSRARRKSALLSPFDLQCIKASGVTFAISAMERVIEERCRGDASKADSLRASLRERIGADIRSVKPGSEEAKKLKAALIADGLWSQYLEVAIGPGRGDLHQGADAVVGGLGRLDRRALRFGLEQPRARDRARGR